MDLAGWSAERVWGWGLERSGRGLTIYFLSSRDTDFFFSGTCKRTACHFVKKKKLGFLNIAPRLLDYVRPFFASKNDHNLVFYPLLASSFSFLECRLLEF